MDIQFFKIKKDTEIGEQLLSVIKEAELCEEKADSFVKGQGGFAYLSDPQADFGGVAGIAFERTILDKKVWDALPLPDAEETYYVPRVNIREELLSVEEAAKYEGSKEVTVSKDEMTFEQVQFRFAREEAAKEAGVTLTTPSLERLGKRHKISRKTLNMLSMGAAPEMVIGHYPEEVQREVRLSLMEDKQIQDAMKDKRYKLVHHYEGDKRAVKIYREMISLPVVPMGMVNWMLDVDSKTHRCGLLDAGEYIYITSVEPVKLKEAEAVSEEEFHSVTHSTINPHETN